MVRFPAINAKLNPQQTDQLMEHTLSLANFLIHVLSSVRHSYATQR
jgi:hypothetical protein